MLEKNASKSQLLKCKTLVSESPYNKLIRKRFNRFLGKKFSFVGMIIRMYETTFTLKAQTYLKKPELVFDNSACSINKKYVDLSEDFEYVKSQSLREYRKRCFIKTRFPYENGIFVTFYSIFHENILPDITQSGFYFIYINGVFKSNSYTLAKPKFTGNDKTTWVIFDCDQNVINFHPDFGHSKFEFKLICDEVLNFKELYLKNSLKDQLLFIQNTEKSKEKISEYYKFILKNYLIKSPFPLYFQQKIIIEKVLDACEKQENAIINSPTGSGKTLAVLCALLSWRDSCEKFNSKILYFSRTYDQLQQITNELRKTVYDPVCTIMGSKEKLCPIKNIENSGLSAVDACFKARSNNMCSYTIAQYPFLKDPIIDIEDLVFTKNTRLCPYYTSKNISEMSDICLMPYAFLFDPYVRKTIPQISFENSLVVVDEGHNLIHECENVFGFTVSYSQFVSSRKNLNAEQNLSANFMMKYISEHNEKDNIIINELFSFLQDCILKECYI